MYWKNIFPISTIILPLVFAAGCSLEGEPYLVVDVRQVYENRHVSIPYQFSSENENQPCRIVVTRENGAAGEVVSMEDRRLDNDGELYFELENGFYTLRFTVLSERGGQLYELSFLSDEFDFSVQDSSSGGAP